MANAVAITGASSGIGKAIALEYARRGANLVLMARRMDMLESLSQELSAQFPNIRVFCVKLDVADIDSVYPAIEEADRLVGGLDTVIANAGITDVHRTGVGDFKKSLRVIQINLIGGMATVDGAARLFRASKRKGTIVGVSSVSAFKGIPGSAAYSGSKAGFSNYLGATRMELKKHGIDVLVVHPGFVKTDLSPNMEKYPFVISAEKAAKEIVNGIEKGTANIVVPTMPWKVLGHVVPYLPDAMYNKMF